MSSSARSSVLSTSLGDARSCSSPPERLHGRDAGPAVRRPRGDRRLHHPGHEYLWHFRSQGTGTSECRPTREAATGLPSPSPAKRECPRSFYLLLRGASPPPCPSLGKVHLAAGMSHFGRYPFRMLRGKRQRLAPQTERAVGHGHYTPPPSASQRGTVHPSTDASVWPNTDVPPRPDCFASLTWGAWPPRAFHPGGPRTRKRSESVSYLGALSSS